MTFCCISMNGWTVLHESNLSKLYASSAKLLSSFHQIQLTLINQKEAQSYESHCFTSLISDSQRTSSCRDLISFCMHLRRSLRIARCRRIQCVYNLYDCKKFLDNYCIRRLKPKLATFFLEYFCRLRSNLATFILEANLSFFLSLQVVENLNST